MVACFNHALCFYVSRFLTRLHTLVCTQLAVIPVRSVLNARTVCMHSSANQPIKPTHYTAANYI